MNTSTPLLRAAALATWALVGHSTAHAQAFDAVRLHAAPPTRDGGSAGLAVIAGTRYLGSDQRRTLAVPVLDYQWANGWFAGVSNGIGYNFSGSTGLQYGLRITADLGRKESRSTALRGMGDVDAGGEVGGFFNADVGGGLWLTTSLRYGGGDDRKGLVADVGASWSTPFGDGWRLGVGASLSAANGGTMQSYFGVSAAQAARSGYAPYTVKAGLRDVRTSTSLSYAYSRDVRITGVLTTTTLSGDAADSPLTRKKSSASGVLALTYAY